MEGLLTHWDSEWRMLCKKRGAITLTIFRVKLKTV